MFSAYEFGQDAYLRGEDISMNPYDEGTPQHIRWIAGYSYAEFRDNEYATGD
jgi:hypothetical protein